MEIDTLNAAQTVFSVFYAILFGAIFTVSDKWRPFTFAGSINPQGYKRVKCSLLLLVGIPVIYFIFCIWILTWTYFCKLGFINLAITIFLVLPSYFPYFFWARHLSSQRDRYYSKREQHRSPVRESLFWTGSHPPLLKRWANMRNAWAVFTNLIALGIAVAVFYKADSDYQKIVFSLLVMIYLRFAVFEGWTHKKYCEALAALGKDFWGIKKLLQEEKEGFKEFREGYEVEIAKAEKDMDRVRLRVHIETGICSITFFIALYHLLRGLHLF